MGCRYIVGAAAMSDKIEYDIGSDLLSRRYRTIPNDGKFHHVELRRSRGEPWLTFVDGVEQMPTDKEWDAYLEKQGWVVMDEIRFKHDMPAPSKNFEPPTTMGWRK